MNEGSGYYEKDGEELTMDITTHEAFIEKQRIAQIWWSSSRRSASTPPTATRPAAPGTTNRDFGDFETRMGWQTCGSVNEPWNSMDSLQRPVAGARGRARQPQPVALVGRERRRSSAPSSTRSVFCRWVIPTIDDLFVEAMGYWFEDLPVIPITQAKKIIPFSTLPTGRTGRQPTTRTSTRPRGGSTRTRSSTCSSPRSSSACRVM